MRWWTPGVFTSKHQLYTLNKYDFLSIPIVSQAYSQGSTNAFGCQRPTLQHPYLSRKGPSQLITWALSRRPACLGACPALPDLGGIQWFPLQGTAHPLTVVQFILLTQLKVWRWASAGVAPGAQWCQRRWAWTPPRALGHHTTVFKGKQPRSPPQPS